MIGTIWHGFEIAMMAFHGFIWGRFALRRIWKAITVSNTIHYKKDVDLKSISTSMEEVTGIGTTTRGQPTNVSSLNALFKEAYGDKIMDLIPMQHKDAFRIVNKDGTEDEIDHKGLVDWQLNVQNPRHNTVIKKLV